jgi:DNA-directed RNA polymerase subunit K/omega
MGGQKDILTSEKLKKSFPNQFDLVNSAIKCARDIIRSENRAPVDGENQNVAALAIIQLEIDIASKDE